MRLLNPYILSFFVTFSVSYCSALKEKSSEEYFSSQEIKDSQNLCFPSNEESPLSGSTEKKDFPRDRYNELTGKFSESSSKLILALGIENEALDLLNETDLQKKSTAKQKLLNKVNYYSIRLSSIIAQIDCEEERADQISGYLDNLNRTEESRFTVYAILAGAGFAVLTGSLYLYDPSMNSVEGLVVLGGLLEGYFGYRILTVEHRENFLHPINPIKEVYSPENGSAFFPDFLWIILSDPNYSLSRSDTMQEKLSRRWNQFERKEIDKLEIEDDGSKRKAWEILLSDGGIYTAKMLKLRASMLDQIEANISLVKYNLALLYKEIMEL